MSLFSRENFDAKEWLNLQLGEDAGLGADEDAVVGRLNASLASLAQAKEKAHLGLRGATQEILESNPAVATEMDMLFKECQSLSAFLAESAENVYEVRMCVSVCVCVCLSVCLYMCVCV
jgi:isocitrate lyase